MITLAKVEMNGQSWHVYRRGEGGPLALTIDAPAQRTHLSMDVTPAILAVMGTMFGQALERA